MWSAKRHVMSTPALYPMTVSRSIVVEAPGNASVVKGKTSLSSDIVNPVTNVCSVMKNDGPPKTVKSMFAAAGMIQPTVMCWPSSRRAIPASSDSVVRGLLNCSGCGTLASTLPAPLLSKKETANPACSPRHTRTPTLAS